MSAEYGKDRYALTHMLFVRIPLPDLKRYVTESESDEGAPRVPNSVSYLRDKL